MKCKICGETNQYIFSSKIMNEYTIEYFHCRNCGFLQTEEPYWLDKAYENPINMEDTGILRRNLRLRNITSIIINIVFDKNSKFLDFGGGHGIFTRLMRDIGYDFYWMDKYAENIFSRGFEYNNKDKVTLITSFESFEHFQNPQVDINNMLKISRNIVFTTQLLPHPLPKPSEWWYYGLSHGQHISFYSSKTLIYIAEKNKLNIHSFGDVHILTEMKIGKLKKILLSLANRVSGFEPCNVKIGNKTIHDMNYLISSKKGDS